MVLGPFPGSTGRSPTELVNEIDPATGVITYVVFTTGGSIGPDGDGMLAFVDLQARALGETALDLKDVELTDIGGNPQDASGGDSIAIVASPPNLAEVSILKSADPATHLFPRRSTFVQRDRFRPPPLERHLPGRQRHPERHASARVVQRHLERHSLRPRRRLYG